MIRRLRQLPSSKSVELTAVDFHTHLSDPLQYACRLLRKVHASGAWAQVHANEMWCSKLNAALWSFSPLEFLGHAVWGECAAVVRRSPILLMPFQRPEPMALAPLKPRQVLIGLDADFDPTAVNLAPFTRIVELIPTDEASLSAARARFRAYRAQGSRYEVQTHDGRLRN